jgi:hypothetical protein
VTMALTSLAAWRCTKKCMLVCVTTALIAFINKRLG